jgi:hypothetical protein
VERAGEARGGGDAFHGEGRGLQQAGGVAQPGVPQRAHGGVAELLGEEVGEAGGGEGDLGRQGRDRVRGTRVGRDQCLDPAHPGVNTRAPGGRCRRRGQQDDLLHAAQRQLPGARAVRHRDPPRLRLPARLGRGRVARPAGVGVHARERRPDARPYARRHGRDGVQTVADPEGPQPGAPGGPCLAVHPPERPRLRARRDRVTVRHARPQHHQIAGTGHRIGLALSHLTAPARGPGEQPAVRAARPVHGVAGTLVEVADRHQPAGRRRHSRGSSSFRQVLSIHGHPHDGSLGLASGP